MYGLILAFKDFNYNLGIVGSPWASNYGFEYFYKLFRMPTFWNVTMNTVIISFSKLIIGFPAPIILAILINELISNSGLEIFSVANEGTKIRIWIKI